MPVRINSLLRQYIEEIGEIYGEHLKSVILYCSYSREDFRPESDIDIMVLLNCEQKEIMERRKEISRIASRVGLKNDIMVSLLARNCADYENQMEYQPFYQNIEREGVEIYG